MSRSNLFYLLSRVCDESSKNTVSLEIRVCAQTHNRDIHTTSSRGSLAHKIMTVLIPVLVLEFRHDQAKYKK